MSIRIGGPERVLPKAQNGGDSMPDPQHVATATYPPGLVARRFRLLVAAGLALHAAIHTIGVVSAWGLGEIPQLGGPTLVAAGAEPGDPATIVLGILWLGAMVMLVIGAISAARGTSRWVEIVAAGAAASVVPSAIWWSDAIIGVMVNVTILVGVLAWRIKIAAPRRPRQEGLI